MTLHRNLKFLHKVTHHLVSLSPGQSIPQNYFTILYNLLFRLSELFPSEGENFLAVIISWSWPTYTIKGLNWWVEEIDSKKLYTKWSNLLFLSLKYTEADSNQYSHFYTVVAASSKRFRLFVQHRSNHSCSLNYGRKAISEKKTQSIKWGENRLLPLCCILVEIQLIWQTQQRTPHGMMRKKPFKQHSNPLDGWAGIGRGTCYIWNGGSTKDIMHSIGCGYNVQCTKDKI